MTFTAADQIVVVCRNIPTHVVFGDNRKERQSQEPYGKLTPLIDDPSAMKVWAMTISIRLFGTTEGYHLVPRPKMNPWN